MKKIFLILMLFLLPLQYTWAMVASYDMHDAQDNEVHFGHHEHHVDALSSDAHSNQPDNQTTKNQSTKNLDNHLHLGFFHLSCGELIDYALPEFEQQVVQVTTPYLFTYHSPPSYQLERPNWAPLV
jgi:hypothetical protein